MTKESGKQGIWNEDGRPVGGRMNIRACGQSGHAIFQNWQE